MLQTLLCLVCAIGLDSDSDTDPKDLSPVTEEVAEILSKWEAASGEAKKCKIEFHRTVYNLVFQTDSRSEGELFWQMPHNVRCILRPAPLPKNAADPKEHREIGRFKAIEGKTWNHPLLAHGRLIVRNSEEMACFELTPTLSTANRD